MQGINAKSNPTPLTQRQAAFNRARSLDNEISIMVVANLEQGHFEYKTIKDTDFALIKRLGFKSVRLPVAFARFETNKITIEKVFTHIDEVLEQCNTYGLKLIIDYHYGNLNDSNYLTETPKSLTNGLN